MQTRILPLISPAARALVGEHAAAGDLLAIVTATNSFVTGPIVREFGIPHLIATIPAQEDGRFTGAPRGLPAFQAGKVARVDAWLESLGTWLGAFEQSWFYSDSHNDLPLLERVTHPVAVDADETLTRVASERGWMRLTLRG
jgi:HAD superfamily phosphoserine phosphatase-like hydrolase